MTPKKIVTLALPPKDPIPNRAIIQNLEELLELAKEGKLQSFIGCGFMSDGCRLSSWGDFHSNFMEEFGSLNWLVA